MNDVSIVQARDVTSPKDRWTLIEVLDEGDGPDTIAYAAGTWDDYLVLAMRWNGNDERPLGHPTAYGKPTWFIVDGELTWLIVHSFGWRKKWMKLLNFYHGDAPSA